MDGKKRGAETREKRASTKPRTEMDISGGEPHVWQECGNDTNSFNVSMDLAVLDCSNCCTPLRPPLFQCRDGHVACSSCCELRNKCHVCSLPTDSRCRSLETVIEAVKIRCPHSKFGCQEIIPYTQKDTHEESCPFSPYDCPVSSCTFQGSTALVWDHILMEHPTTPRSRFFYDRSFEVALQQEEPFHILRAEDNRIFLVLNFSDERGNSLLIARTGPGPMESDLGYEIKVKGKGSELHLKASPENIRDLKVTSLETFLFVPHGISDSAGEVISVDVRIMKM